MSSLDDMTGAILTLDKLMQPPNPQRSPEVVVMLASLKALSRPGISSADLAADRLRARDLYDRIVKASTSDRQPQVILDDLQMHLEIAKLWQDTSLDRTIGALKEALRVDESDPRLLNNLGALHHLEEKLPEARDQYEAALTKVATAGTKLSDAESLSTTVLYNLARVYEDQGEESMAKEAYDKLLARHPEYVDGEICIDFRRLNTAANLFL
jgi:RNA polymerase-associated protein CTR9